MPAYLHLIRIDLYVHATPEALHPVLAAGHAELDSTDHTQDTFTKRLETIAAAHPELVIDALIDNGYNSFVLLRARRGRVETLAIEERPEGATGSVELPYDELATVTLGRDHDEIAAMLEDLGEELEPDEDVTLPTVYPTEAELRAVVERVAAATVEGGGRFVATASGGARFLVELAPDRGRVTKLTVVTEPALVAKLLLADYPPAPAAPRKPDDKYAQPLYWPQSMQQFIQDQATRTDRSMSWIVQWAFKESRNSIAQTELAAGRDAEPD